MCITCWYSVWGFLHVCTPVLIWCIRMYTFSNYTSYTAVELHTSTLNIQCGNTVFQIPSVTHSRPQPKDNINSSEYYRIAHLNFRKWSHYMCCRNPLYPNNIHQSKTVLKSGRLYIWNHASKVIWLKRYAFCYCACEPCLLGVARCSYYCIRLRRNGMMYCLSWNKLQKRWCSQLSMKHLWLCGNHNHWETTVSHLLIHANTLLPPKFTLHWWKVSNR